MHQCIAMVMQHAQCLLPPTCVPLLAELQLTSSGGPPGHTPLQRNVPTCRDYLSISEPSDDAWRDAIIILCALSQNKRTRITLPASYSIMATKGAPESPAALTGGGHHNKLAGLLAGQIAPSLSTLDTLATCKMFKDVLPISQHGLIDKVIGVETKFLRTALHMLANNKALRDKFGLGLGAAMALASMLREMHSKKVFENIMDNAFDNASTSMGADGLSDPKERAEDLNLDRSVIVQALRSSAAASAACQAEEVIF